ncbi:MAG: hypothetical protein HC869_03705 [Rhodospirillales bacterium]|nr:hypothetical protein [Rhodospirillales bacterium]
MSREIEEIGKLLSEIEANLPKLCRYPQTQQLCEALEKVLPSLRAVVDYWEEESSGRTLPDAFIELLTVLRDFKSLLERDDRWIEV